MGNKISNNNDSGFDEETELDNLSLEDKLDFIATHYILTMDFNSLRKLYEKDYCEKLVLLTSNIIDKNFNHLEIDKLSERIEGGAFKDSENQYSDEQTPEEDIDSYKKRNDYFSRYNDPGLYMYNSPYGVPPPSYGAPPPSYGVPPPSYKQGDLDIGIEEPGIEVKPNPIEIVKPEDQIAFKDPLEKVNPEKSQLELVGDAKTEINADLNNDLEKKENESEQQPLQVDPVPLTGLDTSLDTGLDKSLPEKEKIYYLDKDELLKLNMEKGEKRKMICNEIAKFYIKIAHLFAAIVTTISPEYEYTDYWGKKVKKSFSEKNSIPKGVQVKVTRLNLCSKHIEQLKGENNDDILDSNVQEINVKPELCDFGLKDDDSSDSEEYTTLEKQPGIIQLEELYNDDNYDFKTGTFKGRTLEMSQKYRSDLEKFYKAFTGEAFMPLNIEKFGQIPLKKYKNGEVCKKIKKESEKSESKSDEESKNEEKEDLKGGSKEADSKEVDPKEVDLKEVDPKEVDSKEVDSKEESEDKKTSLKLGQYKGSYQDELFSKYADNLRKMTSFVNEKQKELIKIIDELFIVYNDSNTGKKHIRVNPELNMESLNSIIGHAREIIVELYLTCQDDYEEGIKIYEAIVESLTIKMVEKQIEKLEGLKEDLTSFSELSGSQSQPIETSLPSKLSTEVKNI